ncbi:hypothetical protein F5Y13DRAFT_161547 [Hypoxylon sp. FL1857]|nr:hypothetical protein F5Y13DRAFT_161547 [Hypoxylon sp. FL1857]
MDLSKVGGVVEALVATYTAGLDYYTKWQRRKWRENHYQASAKDSLCGGNACALSTSLGFSSGRIKEAFDDGVDILGNEFATGDEICRETLQGNLELLQEQIYDLYEATRVENGLLELYEAVHVSESVCVSSLAALAGLYKRIAVGRLVPQVLPASQQRPRLSIAIPEEETVKPPDDSVGVDGDVIENIQIAYHTASPTKPPYLQSEPPSPPPTPKQIPDDLQSACASATSGYGPRPKNSVFSMFCPEALKYQVNSQKTMPKNRNCKCGYDWHEASTEDGTAMAVKDGFRITARFLGKSHCDGGFGCVLCTSSGRTEIYPSIEDLKDHINVSHTKWQMLHDRDMVGLKRHLATGSLGT